LPAGAAICPVERPAGEVAGGCFGASSGGNRHRVLGAKIEEAIADLSVTRNVVPIDHEVDESGLILGLTTPDETPVGKDLFGSYLDPRVLKVVHHVVG
jgi:hypothetical protein